MLVLMAVTPHGRKELIAVTDGFRESEQSWAELLLDLKKRGLTIALTLAIGDGALGFWAALRKVSGETREQRCWMHKTANILNKMPQSVQGKAKSDIHEIWLNGHDMIISSLGRQEIRQRRNSGRRLNWNTTIYNTSSAFADPICSGARPAVRP